MWECDGCGLIGTLDEVNRHILSQDVDYDDLSTIKCWGAMEIGSDVWQDYHQKGTHPMTQILGAIEGTMMSDGRYMGLILDEPTD